MTDTESGADAAQVRRERLSALMDGELAADAAEACCVHWRELADTRSSWHVYHVIGDVLRSEELACGAGHDARLLDAVRSRLAAEPAVLAPGSRLPHGSGAGEWSGRGISEPALPRRRWGWLATSAAVGVMVVTGLTVLVQAPPSPAPAAHAGETLTSLPAPGDAGEAIAVLTRQPTPLADEPAPVVEGPLLRDAQLDRYLAAHKQFGGSSALGVPSGFLRSATLQAPAR